MYLLGLDIGSSSIKAALVDAQTRRMIASVQSPAAEMSMISQQSGWAEQNPADWWSHVCLAIQRLLRQTEIQAASISSIGIAYQMHGLVLLDIEGQVLRPSIIWCDSRAVSIGNTAYEKMGAAYCQTHLLNSPANFTAAKLKWVQENEPTIYQRIHKVMLPGDYIAYKLTGELVTTASGLSEGIFWDFKANQPSCTLLNYFGFDADLLPTVVQTFGIQGEVTTIAAAETGLCMGTPVTYRAGDQPNNALSLNVLDVGEVAATGGTSGVVYGVVDTLAFDAQHRVNSFAHVNHQAELPKIGVLLCINGAGIQYRWIRDHIAPEGIGYRDMEVAMHRVPIGCDGLTILPFGNGAERMLGNRGLNAQISGLQLNRHTRQYFYRAGLEGIAFSFVYGIQILQAMGLNIGVMRVGSDNLFQSEVFSNTIANTVGCQIDMMQTNGATGAAIASGYGIGIYTTLKEGLSGLKTERVFEPIGHTEAYQAAYQNWLNELHRAIND